MYPFLNRFSILWNMSHRPLSAEIIRSVLNVSLKTPTVTRWNSLYDTVTQLLSFKDKLNDLCMRFDKPKFTAKDFEYLKSYATVMLPIATTLDFLQSEGKMYFGYFVPSVVSLKKRTRRTSKKRRS